MTQRQSKNMVYLPFNSFIITILNNFIIAIVNRDIATLLQHLTQKQF